MSIVEELHSIHMHSVIIHHFKISVILMYYSKLTDAPYRYI